MSRIQISRAERIQMFLYEYYFGVSAIQTLMRIVGGPVILYFGIDLSLSEVMNRPKIVYGAFMIIFGTYYMFRPLYWILVRWKLLKAISFDLEMDDSTFQIIEEYSETSIDFTKFESIEKRKRYFSFKIEGSKIYLPIKALSSQEVEFFESKLLG